GLDGGLEPPSPARVRPAVNAPDEAAVLQVGQIAPDRLADHSETVRERGNRDSLFLPDQRQDLVRALVAEQAGPLRAALPGSAPSPGTARGLLGGQDALPV